MARYLGDLPSRGLLTVQPGQLGYKQRTVAPKYISLRSTEPPRVRDSMTESAQTVPDTNKYSTGLSTTMPKTIADLPDHIIFRVLLTATTHDDLLHHVSVCARVCPGWYRNVRGSAAYGMGWAADAAGRAERARVLSLTSEALQVARGPVPRRYHTLASAVRTPVPRRPFYLLLGGKNIGDDGGKALGAALQVWPTQLTEIDLSDNQLTEAALAPITTALRRGFAGEGLRTLKIRGNPGLGDAGLTLLSGALPPSLYKLDISNTACADAGILAITAALPHCTALASLILDGNHYGAVGRAALNATTKLRLIAVSTIIDQKLIQAQQQQEIYRGTGGRYLPVPQRVAIGFCVTLLQSLVHDLRSHLEVIQQQGLMQGFVLGLRRVGWLVETNTPDPQRATPPTLQEIADFLRASFTACKDKLQALQCDA